MPVKAVEKGASQRLTLRFFNGLLSVSEDATHIVAYHAHLAYAVHVLAYASGWCASVTTVSVSTA